MKSYHNCHHNCQRSNRLNAIAQALLCKRTIVAFYLLALIATPITQLFFQTAAQAANSCLNCHISSKEKPPIYHENWIGSIHQKKGVECSSCHGGQADEQDKEKAHRGIKHSKDRKSRLHENRLSTTCGKCHSIIYRLFTKSDHYKRLSFATSVINCTTCHNAVDAKIISEITLSKECGSCHISRLKIAPQVPEQIKTTMMLFMQSRSILSFADTLVKSGGLYTADFITDRLNKIKSSMSEAETRWHSFEFAGMNASTFQVYKEADALIELLLTDSSVIKSMDEAAEKEQRRVEKKPSTKKAAKTKPKTKQKEKKAVKKK